MAKLTAAYHEEDPGIRVTLTPEDTDLGDSPTVIYITNRIEAQVFSNEFQTAHEKMLEAQDG